MSVVNSGESLAIEGSAAFMRAVGDGEADLIVTSPPYFSSTTEKLLREPRSAQTDVQRVQAEVTAFALKLRPVFDEIARVLRRGGALVLQTKDIQYGGFLLPLADTHVEMALSCGLQLLTRVMWTPIPPKRERIPAFSRTPKVGNFRALEFEWFLVFTHPENIDEGPALSEFRESARELVFPLWRTRGDTHKGHHPFGSPPLVVARFIRLFSKPGDLVLDPFAGYGTTLVEARKLGRRAIGYEIDHEWFEKLQARVERTV